MGKTVETIINRFDGGMSNDLRVQVANKYSITSHFDALTYPHKLVPHYATEAKENKTYDIREFTYALSTGTTYRLFGLGLGGTGKASIFTLNPVSGDWLETGNNASTLGRNLGCLFYYKLYMYIWGGTAKLCRWKTDGEVFNDNYQDVTSFSTICQPVHHPADDCAYFFHDNIVSRLNDTVWSATVLTLPSNLKIVKACAFGNYLAIACVTNGGSDVQSVVYLWDRDSSLATITEIIDFGKGEIIHLANLDNKLTAVMNFGANNALGLNKGKILIKQPNGLKGKTINEIETDNTSADLPANDFIEGDKLYFPAKIPFNGDNRLGIWVVDSLGRLSLDFVEEEATSITGIYKILNQWYIAHSADGSVNRTASDRSYSATLASVYESLKNLGDARLNIPYQKKLLSVGVMSEPLPTTGQIVLKYRKNEETSWTTIFTHTTDNSGFHEAVNIESSGVNLPEYNEIELRVESTGGAVITGLKMVSEVLGKKPS